MEKLINYINQQLKWAKDTPQYAEAFCHNAFGALQFYIVANDLRGTEYAELESQWNETYRPQFEVLVYGGDVV